MSNDFMIEAIHFLCPFKPVSPHVSAEKAQTHTMRFALKHGLCTIDTFNQLNKQHIARLEALVFPTATEDLLYLAADWTTFFCCLDDELESSQQTPIEIAKYLSGLLATFKHGYAYSYGPMCSALLDIHGRMSLHATQTWINSFQDVLEELFEAFLWEACNRWSNLIPSRSAYEEMRMITVGLKPQFLLAELSEGAQLPYDTSLCKVTCAIVGLQNDICTYAREKAVGEVHNFVNVLIANEYLSEESARKMAVRTHDDYVMELSNQETSDSKEDWWIEMLRRWIVGHLEWSKETKRYYIAYDMGL